MSSGVVVQLALDCGAAASLYALVALAVALAASGSGVVHLAIGQVASGGGLVAAALLAGGRPLWLAVIAGLAAGALLSSLLERGLVAPAAGRALLGTVLLVAAAVVLRELLVALFPRDAYAFPSVPGTLQVGGGLLHWADVVTVAVVLVTGLAGATVLRLTSFGVALRVVAAAPAVAERIGVESARIRTLSFAAGGVLATAAVLLGAARSPIAAGGGVALALRGVASAVAGGMRSPAVIAGAAVLIAVAQVVGVYFLGGGGEAIADGVAVALVAARLRP